MCLITCIPSGVEKNMSYIEQCVRSGMASNADGSGFAIWRKETKRTYIKKGYGSATLLMEDLKNAAPQLEDAVIIHHRIGTQGSKTASNCHPYGIDPRSMEDAVTALGVTSQVNHFGALAHNGCMNHNEYTNPSSVRQHFNLQARTLPENFQVASWSDTALYTLDILSNPKNYKLITNADVTTVQKLLAATAGEWQKLALILPEQGLITSGRFETDEHGLLHSNSGYKTYIYDRGGSSFRESNRNVSLDICDFCGQECENSGGGSALTTYEGSELCNSCLTYMYAWEKEVAEEKEEKEKTKTKQNHITIKISISESVRKLKFNSTPDDRSPKEPAELSTPVMAPARFVREAKDLDEKIRILRNAKIELQEAVGDAAFKTIAKYISHYAPMHLHAGLITHVLAKDYDFNTTNIRLQFNTDKELIANGNYQMQMRIADTPPPGSTMTPEEYNKTVLKVHNKSFAQTIFCKDLVYGINLWLVRDKVRTLSGITGIRANSEWIIENLEAVLKEPNNTMIDFLKLSEIDTRSKNFYKKLVKAINKNDDGYYTSITTQVNFTKKRTIVSTGVAKVYLALFSDETYFSSKQQDLFYKILSYVSKRIMAYSISNRPRQVSTPILLS